MADHGNADKDKKKEAKAKKKEAADAKAEKKQKFTRAGFVAALAGGIGLGILFNGGFTSIGGSSSGFPWGCYGSFKIKLTAKELEVPQCYIDNIHATAGVVDAIGFLGKEKRIIEIHPFEAVNWPRKFELRWVRAQKGEAELSGTLSQRKP